MVHQQPRRDFNFVGHGNFSCSGSIMNFKQFDNEHVAQAWERMKSLVKNCPTHGLTTWMIIQTFYAGLNFSSRNLLDSAAGGTFMSITLGAATKLLDDMMINYSEWHTERTPQGKKVNSVEETSSLGDKIDAIMSMLANGRSHIDPNNVPLASLVAQEENVDVNFIKNNNFNNNAYRNNYGNNNYRPYPSNNGNGYGNSYGNSYNNNKSVPSGLEVMLKEFISTQTAFNKTVEEKLSKIDILASKVDSLALDVDLLKLKVMPEKVEDARFAKTNSIQVRINDNIRMLAELHARWDREEKEKLAKENNVAKVWTITTTSNVDSSHVAAPPTINGKIIGVGNVSTPSTKRAKLPETAETAVCDKTAEIFQNIGDNDSIAVEHNGLDFDDCHITEVIKFLQKLARSPNASAINLAFTKHITNALIKAREEKLKLEASIPRKLEDGWEPIIKMKFNDFECNALCDLGASISVMPKKIYDMLNLPPLKNCYLDVNLADNVKKKPLGRIDNIIEAMAALNAGAPGAGRGDIVNAVARTAVVASADRRLSLHGVVAVVGTMQPAMGVGVVAELFAARFGEPASRVEATVHAPGEFLLYFADPATRRAALAVQGPVVMGGASFLLTPWDRLRGAMPAILPYKVSLVGKMLKIKTSYDYGYFDFYDGTGHINCRIRKFSDYNQITSHMLTVIAVHKMLVPEPYMKCYSIFYYQLAEQLYKKVIEKLRCALFIIFNLWIELAVASVYVMLHSVDLCTKG
ncbi:hypothetical protein QYE76_051172 [Lolium multiflorum]|uniref:Retrotransposon gag domain-containing protein n=1 Tax=Lolium multiflorum TaxID=4521 RepID=A0AAD8SRE2_LOLMU|nr:hypothetical protein QYE76_051172 [Lolium multiflorum]